MRLQRTTSAFIASVCLVAGSRAFAQTADSGWVGQRIVMLSGMGEVHSPLDSMQVASQVGINLVMPVTRVEGRRLWVVSTSGGDSGWVDSDAVRRLPEAIPYFTHLIEREPSNWDAYLRRAEAEHALNQRDAATADYSKAIELHPAEAFLYLRRGRHYNTLRACDRALSDFDKAITLAPTSAPQGYNLVVELYSLESSVYSGCADSTLRDPRRAIATIQHAIALDSTRATFFVILAGAYASGGNLTAAVDALKRALASPGAAPSYRPYWQRQLDEYERALATQRVKRQGSSASDSAMALNRTGRWSEAADQARRYLASARLGSRDESCRVRVMLAYSEMQLVHQDSANAVLASADSTCEGTRAKEEMAHDLAQLHRNVPGLARLGASPSSDGSWATGDPRTLGLNVRALEGHLSICERTGADACLVVYRDTIVQEWYSPRYREPMYAMSSTKSITALLVGMLLDEGRLKSLDDRVCTYVRNWCDGLRARVTLRHLLSMTSGLPRMYANGVGYTSDKDKFVEDLTPTNEPGSSWAYSNEGAQLLSPILDAAAGEPIQDYALRRLFRPLGMDHTRLHADGKGHAWTYADAETTPRDLARLGRLILHKGLSDGRRIVSQAWIETATQPSQQMNPRYGLLWWIDPEAKAIAMHGHLDTDVHILPDLALVVVRMQTRPFAGVPEGTYEREAVPLYREFVAREAH